MAYGDLDCFLVDVVGKWNVASHSRKTSRVIAKINRGIWPLVFCITRLVYTNRRLASVNRHSLSTNRRLASMNRHSLSSNRRLAPANRRLCPTNRRLVSPNRRPVPVNRRSFHPINDPARQSPGSGQQSTPIAHRRVWIRDTSAEFVPVHRNATSPTCVNMCGRAQLHRRHTAHGMQDASSLPTLAYSALGRLRHPPNLAAAVLLDVATTTVERLVKSANQAFGSDGGTQIIMQQCNHRTLLPVTT